jgi:hypothetical protein
MGVLFSHVSILSALSRLVSSRTNFRSGGEIRNDDISWSLKIG